MLRQGDSLTLTAGPVRKMVAGREAVLYGFNGQVPGPLLVVPEAATVVVVPSPYESLSLLALESFAVGTPILANARSEVLVDHCQKSNAGLYYADRDEFGECLRLLLADHRLRAAMGRNGRAYVRQNYRWDVILGKYERMFAKLRSQPQPAARR